MTDSKVDKAQKSTDIEHKTAKKQDESQAKTTKEKDLEGTQKELDAALASPRGWTRPVVCPVNCMFEVFWCSYTFVLVYVSTVVIGRVAD